MTFEVWFARHYNDLWHGGKRRRAMAADAIVAKRRLS